MIRVLLAGEDEGHRSSCGCLLDRLVVEHVEPTLRDEALEAKALERARAWLEHEGRPYIDVHHAFADARARRLPVYGHFDGQPAKVEAHQWRAVFHLAMHRPDVPHVVIAARDDDGDPRRAEGLEQARALGWPFDVIRAIATQEIEAWAMAGFFPMDAEERRTLARQTERFGFDPTRHSERLTGGTERDAKRALDELTREDPDRRAVCLDSVPLTELRARGAHNGLSTFMEETRVVLRKHLGGDGSASAGTSR